MKPGATKSIYDKFVIYRFKDYLFIWAWNDGYPLWLYFLATPFSFLPRSFCTASTQHNTNVMQITRRTEALHKIAIICEKEYFSNADLHIFLLDPDFSYQPVHISNTHVVNDQAAWSDDPVLAERSMTVTASFKFDDLEVRFTRFVFHFPNVSSTSR